jgi:hypothetical protein
VENRPKGAVGIIAIGNAARGVWEQFSGDPKLKRWLEKADTKSVTVSVARAQNPKLHFIVTVGTEKHGVDRGVVHGSYFICSVAGSTSDELNRAVAAFVLLGLDDFAAADALKLLPV